MRPELIRRAAWTSGAVLAACILLLTIDWAFAAYRAPKDEALVKRLQKDVQQSAAVAPKLEAEQKRITGSLLARRRRGRVIAWTIIAAAAVFIAATKRLVAAKGHRFVALETLKTPAPAKAKPKRRKPKPAEPPAAPAIDLGFVDECVARLGRGKESAIPLLQAIQTHYRYLPDEALRRVCELTAITPAEISGTSSFYGQFRRSPVGKHIVRVCHGTACHVAGARQISDELRRHLQLPEGADTDAQRMFTLEEVACLGCCSLAPVLMVDEHTAGRLTPLTAPAALEDAAQREPA